MLGGFENATHTGLHLEKIAGTRDTRLRSIRIDQFWRGIVIAPPLVRQEMRVAHLVSQK